MVKKHKTKDKFVRDILDAKRKGAVIMFRDGMYYGSDIFDICEAYRRVGFMEGYKKGKRDGSWAGYNVGFDEGYREAEFMYIDDDDYEDLCWDD